MKARSLYYTLRMIPMIMVGSSSVQSDGTWENSRVIALHEAVELDPSLLQLADLPVGWHAVRDSPDDPWRREVIDEA